jgi:hypothetical protein
MNFRTYGLPACQIIDHGGEYSGTSSLTARLGPIPAV